ncbi:MAG: peptidoglycan DD-metalloendopeptidase family protein [Acidimicrobiia bacterium]
MEILHYLPRQCARVVLLVLLVLGVMSQDQTVAPAAADTGVTGWLTPVDGPVVRPFEAPTSAYGPGHRGVDFAASPGAPVHAANDGVVTFAGSVAGTLHVTVAHAGGLRTSYSFLATVSVRTGQSVARGDVVGTSGGIGPDHDGSVLHFGLRVGDQYVDPMVLFRPADLTKLVHLVPAPDPAGSPWSAAAERRELQTSLRLASPGGGSSLAATGGASDAGGSCGSGVPLLGAAVDAVCDVGGWLGDGAGDAIDSGLDYLDAVTNVASTVLDNLRQPLHDAVESMRALSAELASAAARTPIGALALDIVEIGRRFAATVTADCSDDAPEADGTGGSGHRVMVVAGINSHGDGNQGPTVALDVEALGYHVGEGEVRYFSYAADGGAYTARDTHGPIEVAAARLGEQLRAMQRDQPGREVDLIAHSLGGVVVDYFLGNYYHPGDPTFPPLGNVVTLSSPHQGAPLATAGAQIRSTPVGRLALDGAEGVSSLPPSSSRAVQELAEHSSFMDHLWDQGIPEHFDFTTIGATEDLVVPATEISVPGATETVVAGDSVNEHSDIVRDPDALRAVRAALEGRPPPCVGLATALRSAVAPVVISRIEHTIGRGAAAASGGIGQ